MKLNHINLVVSNVEDAIIFFETYFNFTCIEIKGENIVAVLIGSDGFTLVLMKNKSGAPAYPEAFHIGFMQNSKDEVIEIFQKLKIADFVGGQEPKKIRDSFGFYFHYQHLMIEVGYYW